MLEKLKAEVCLQNRSLVKLGLVIFTWGNVSAINRENGLVAIKPSGVDYGNLTLEDIVIVDLDGKIIEGRLNPSSDMPTHLELYKKFQGIGGIVHTHSTFATAWAQSGKPIPCFGTTHADYFYGEIPCSRELTEAEVKTDYEKNTGLVITQTFTDCDPLATPAVIIKNHGPFTWGKDAAEAVHNAAVLEEVAKMAYLSKTIYAGIAPVDQFLMDKHYFRKHGSNAYYGQKKEKK